jgi:hypothetical protein
VVNADGTNRQILISERAPAAVGNGLMVRTNVEALIAAERSYTQSAIFQALVPLQEENKALRDQLESMKGVQEKTVRAVNLQAQSSSAALAEMKAAQELHHKEQQAAMLLQSQAGAAHASQLFQQMQTQMEQSLSKTLFSENFKAFLHSAPTPPSDSGDPNRT